MESVLNGELGGVLDALDMALDGVGAAGVDPADHRDAVAVLKRVERIGVRIDAVRVAVMESVDDKLLYAADGHFSAKVMTRHVNRLSGVEASRRWSMVRALREMPELKSAFEAGQVGSCQTRLLARVFSNKRVREQLIADLQQFIELAERCSFRDFEIAVADWVRLVDEDGTADTAQANHENRDLKLVQEFDGGWVISGRCGSIQGAQLEDILKHFIDAEFKTDWERAKNLYGDNVVKDQLERSDAQRRFDAFLEIMMRAATNYGPGARPSVVTNIVLDHETFERELAKIFGGDPGPVDPWSLDFASRTLNGAMIDTTEAAVAALVGKFKRVVIDAASVTIDMSRDTRFFTGNARLAVQIGTTTCTWPGCHVKTTDCQIDHMAPFAERADGRGGGCTCPGNGAPLCGRHNRTKEQGFTVYRDSHGKWHTLRPDGTEIT